LILGPLMFITCMWWVKQPDLSEEGVAVMACTLWVACWWILEVIPISVTALLPIILFPLSGAMDLETTTAAFGHRYIFLYIGGFTLAIAIERWNLHKRIALHIIRLIGTDRKMIVLGFMLATALLSMWISNTATSVMMLPIGLAIIGQFGSGNGGTEADKKSFGRVLMLSIAYSASIGGIATLVGTPPNLVLAGVVQQIFNIEITFFSWMMIGLPISAFLLFTCWKYLTWAKEFQVEQPMKGGIQQIKEQIRALGSVSTPEKRILTVFALTALAWICRSFLINPFFPAVDDTIIAIIAAVLLFMIPAGSEDEVRPLINWEEAVKLPWGVLLLFGGGLAIAKGFSTSGLAEWIGEQLSLLEGLSLVLTLLVLVVAVNFLTEITSNLATTAMLLPILATLAAVIGVHPYMLMVAATLAASCAFMLPVATPPNAIVFGSGYIKIPEMVKTGIWMNIISIVVICIAVYFILPYLWSFSPNQFPNHWGINH